MVLVAWASQRFTKLAATSSAETKLEIRTMLIESTDRTIHELNITWRIRLTSRHWCLIKSRSDIYQRTVTYYLLAYFQEGRGLRRYVYYCLEGSCEESDSKNGIPSLCSAAASCLVIHCIHRVLFHGHVLRGGRVNWRRSLGCRIFTLAIQWQDLAEATIAPYARCVCADVMPRVSLLPLIITTCAITSVFECWCRVEIARHQAT